ncbi:hypothetical protein CPB83DRAFT_649191 [Crepidotus variabilis]|uniref:Nephrocystin 3-like N-terminal domain-containing protein n=1 Tax=Crepidotus variabilis TaxID=179855 RepID=A0A9P6E769_9AGAR|nr:hypothetical protein CPB83DRAFT_649191 [Crepidotus variabilis]
MYSSRSSGHNHKGCLFLSFAYQLAKLNLTMKVAIETALRSDAPLEKQMKHLLLDPIARMGSHFPSVFVSFDGLDEYNGENNQVEMVRLVQSTITAEHPLPIRFLIASRPESWIQNTILSSLGPPFFITNLNEDPESDDDIRLFYISEFNRIHGDVEHIHPMSIDDSSPLASDKEIEELVRRATGQFIYAKTVTRFVDEPGHRPVDRLKDILQHASATSTPLSELDTLYTQILSTVVDWNLTSTVLGALSVFEDNSDQREALSIIEILLELAIGDGHRALRNLHSIALVPHNLHSTRESMPSDEYQLLLDDKCQHVRFYHKSFTDFPHSSHRAGPLFIDLEASHRKMALGCLRIIENLKRISPTRLTSLAWLHAQTRFIEHIIQSGTQGNRQLLAILDNFMFTSWHFSVLRLFPSLSLTWRSFVLLRLVEIWNDDTQRLLERIRKTLEHFHMATLHRWAALSDLQDLAPLRNWMKMQSDVPALAYPRLRFKFWLVSVLHTGLSKTAIRLVALSFLLWFHLLAV